MIEHGIVEASSYTPSRVLSPTLHTIGDFVEVCYHGEKIEPQASDAQAQATSTSLSTVSKQNGLTTASQSWKNVEDLLVTSSQTKSDALTFIPCESGSVVGDVSDIVLCEKSLPLSGGDVTTTKYGDESPGVHSTTHSKAAVTLSGTVVTSLSASSSKAEVIVCNSSTTSDSTTSTQSRTTSAGMMIDLT